MKCTSLIKETNQTWWVSPKVESNNMCIQPRGQVKSTKRNYSNKNYKLQFNSTSLRHHLWLLMQCPLLQRSTGRRNRWTDILLCQYWMEEDQTHSLDIKRKISTRSQTNKKGWGSSWLVWKAFAIGVQLSLSLAAELLRKIRRRRKQNDYTPSTTLQCLKLKLSTYHSVHLMQWKSLRKE